VGIIGRLKQQSVIMPGFLAADFVINPEWLKYGFIGFAAVLALAATTIYQIKRTKSFLMLVSYLTFALILAAMGLISPMIHDAHEDIARQKERDESAEQINALQDKLTYAKKNIADLLDIKSGVLAQLDQEPNQSGRIHNAVATMRKVDEKIGEALVDTTRAKEQLANKP
jgi:hypothetical protein